MMGSINTLSAIPNPLNTLLDSLSKLSPLFVPGASARFTVPKNISSNSRESIQALINNESAILTKNRHYVSVKDNRLTYSQLKQSRVDDYCSSLSPEERNNLTNEIFSESFFQKLNFDTQKEFDDYARDYIFNIISDKSPDLISKFVNRKLRAASFLESKVRTTSEPKVDVVAEKGLKQEYRTFKMEKVERLNGSLKIKLLDPQNENNVKYLKLSVPDEKTLDYLMDQKGKNLEMRFHVAYLNLAGSGMTQCGDPRFVSFPVCNYHLGMENLLRIEKANISF